MSPFPSPCSHREDLSLTPPPLLETGSDQPPQPPGHPDPSQGDFSSKIYEWNFPRFHLSQISFFWDQKKPMKPVKLHDFVMPPELRHYSRQRSGEVKRVPINLALEDSGNFSCEVWKIDFQSSKPPGAKRFVSELQLKQVLHDARCCRFVHPKTYHNFVTASGSPNRCQDPDSAVSADPRPTCRPSHVTLWLFKGLLHLTASQKNLCFLVHFFPGDNPDGSLLGTMDFPLNSRTTSS